MILNQCQLYESDANSTIMLSSCIHQDLHIIIQTNQQQKTSKSNHLHHMSRPNQHYLNQDIPNTQIRQNLINQPHPQEQIPIEGIIPPPIVNPITLYNTLINIEMQSPPVPAVPISQYKHALELWLLSGCLVEIVWLQCTRIHILWIAYFVFLGNFRHRTLNMKLRFWAEFFNLLIWILTFCYVFAGHRSAIFPFVIVLENLDYFFVGGQLTSIYLTHLIYRASNLYADIRLCIIMSKLQSRRNIFIHNLMKKFSQNQVLQTSVQLKPITTDSNQFVESNQLVESNQFVDSQQFVESSMINQAHSGPLQEMPMQSNTCFICKRVMEQKKWTVLNPVRLINCHHRFHYACLHSYVINGRFHCPICAVSFVQ